MEQPPADPWRELYTGCQGRTEPSFQLEAWASRKLAGDESIGCQDTRTVRVFVHGSPAPSPAGSLGIFAVFCFTLPSPGPSTAQCCPSRVTRGSTLHGSCHRRAAGCPSLCHMDASSFSIWGWPRDWLRETLFIFLNGKGRKPYILCGAYEIFDTLEA